jgi:hypothetical protein
MPPMLVRIQLTDFGYSWIPDPNGQPIVSGPPAGQPYLWTVFFKIDGDNVSVGPNFQLQGQSTVVGMPGNQGDLVSGDISGDEYSVTLTIPAEIATWVTVLRPIQMQGNMPIPVVGALPGIIACAAIINVQADTPANAVSAGHDALNTAIKQQLDALLPTFGINNPPTPQTISANISALVSSVQSAVITATQDSLNTWQQVQFFAHFKHPDYPLMVAPFLFSQTNLASAPAQGVPIQQTQNFTVYFGNPPTGDIYSQGPGTYQLSGRLTADPYPLSMKRVLTGLGDPPPVGLRSLLTGSVETWLLTP